MVSSSEVYTSELLFGKDFLRRFKTQLQSLFDNGDFRSIIDSIYLSACPSQEIDVSAEKAVARKMMFDSGAVFAYSDLKEIVDAVSSEGYAKNSALISTYFAMRIMAIEEADASIPNTNSNQRWVSEVDFRLKWPAEFRCEDGHYVRSKNEALIDNWLYSHGICHAYEKSVYSHGSDIVYCSDFFVPSRNLYIEIWGLADESYEKRKADKKAFYNSAGLELLSIEGGQVKCLDDVLSRVLLS